MKKILKNKKLIVIKMGIMKLKTFKIKKIMKNKIRNQNLALYFIY